LKGEKQDVFKDKMIKKGKWNLDEDVDKMWNEMATCTKGCGQPTKETWWNTVVQAAIKLKREQ